MYSLGVWVIVSNCNITKFQEIAFLEEYYCRFLLLTSAFAVSKLKMQETHGNSIENESSRKLSRLSKWKNKIQIDTTVKNSFASIEWTKKNTHDRHDNNAILLINTSHSECQQQFCPNMDLLFRPWIKAVIRIFGLHNLNLLQVSKIIKFCKSSSGVRPEWLCNRSTKCL